MSRIFIPILFLISSVSFAEDSKKLLEENIVTVECKTDSDCVEGCELNTETIKRCLPIAKKKLNPDQGMCKNTIGGLPCSCLSEKKCGYPKQM